MFDVNTLSPSMQILIKGYKNGLFDKLADKPACKQLAEKNKLNPDNLRKTWITLKPMLPLIFPEKFKTIYISYAIRIKKPLLDELQRRHREGDEKMITMINDAITDYLKK